MLLLGFNKPGGAIEFLESLHRLVTTFDATMVGIDEVIFILTGMILDRSRLARKLDVVDELSAPLQ